MTITNSTQCVCGEEAKNISDQSARGLQTILLKMPEEKIQKPCCGPPAGPAATIFEKPGYRLLSFVRGFIETPAGMIPEIKTSLDTRDRASTLLVRTGYGRNDYKVAPGLYAVGEPCKESPVMVTANFKLTFDHLRKELGGIDAWLLVLDTRGINVWCAAGEGTFSTKELVQRIKTSRLEEVVSHKKVILPQLSATGVSAHKVKKESGFEVVWGPVYAKDLFEFINNEMKARPGMKKVTFGMVERLVLVPVEISNIIKPALWILLALTLISGIGPGIFSITAAFYRGGSIAASMAAGIAGGAVLSPLLLPYLPGKAFSVKGLVPGVVLGLPIAIAAGLNNGFSGVAALLIFSIVISSYLAMNFTGATPFTSPSGVEKEMKLAIPVQAVSTLAGLALWIISGF